MENWAITLAAAAPGIASLVWQVITWRRQRKPDVTVTARYGVSVSQDEGHIDVVVVPSQDIAVVAVGLAPAGRSWKRKRVTREKCFGYLSGYGNGPLPLPLGVPATVHMSVYMSQDTLLNDGLDLTDGRDYVAWAKTSSGHLYRSQPFRGKHLVQRDAKQGATASTE